LKKLAFVLKHIFIFKMLKVHRFNGETEGNEGRNTRNSDESRDDSLIVLKDEVDWVTQKGPAQDSDAEEFNFSMTCMMGVVKNSCSSKGLKNPVVINVLLCIVLGIPALVLFALYPQYVLEFIVEHATIIQIVGALVRLLSKILYALSFLPLGTLYKFAIAVLNIDSNIVVALIYEVISTVCEIIAFQYHRVYGKLPDIDELNKFKKKLSEFRSSLDFNEDGVHDGDSDKLNEGTLSTSRKLFELYLIQNAWGVPDTPTTIYFATATNWPIWIFAVGTFASNFTIGLIKVTAWIIALRQVQDKIKDNPDGGLSAWDLLLGIDDKLSLPEKICIMGVSICGFLVCVYRGCKFLWMCYFRSKYQRCRRSHDVGVDIVDSTWAVELPKVEGLSLKEAKRKSSNGRRVDFLRN